MVAPALYFAHLLTLDVHEHAPAEGALLDRLLLLLDLLHALVDLGH